MRNSECIFWLRRHFRCYAIESDRRYFHREWCAQRMLDNCCDRSGVTSCLNILRYSSLGPVLLALSNSCLLTSFVVQVCFESWKQVVTNAVRRPKTPKTHPTDRRTDCPAHRPSDVWGVSQLPHPSAVHPLSTLGPPWLLPAS